MYTINELTLHVLKVIAEIVPSSSLLTETTYLPGLREFDSLMIVMILERLEETLGIEVEPTLILPESFETPGTISELLRKNLALSSMNQQGTHQGI